MKIRDSIDLQTLERFSYNYQDNLVYPTYKKVIRQGKARIVVEILVSSREIFVNKSNRITEKQRKYLIDLERSRLLVD